MFLLDLLHLYLAPLPSWGGLLWLNQGPVTCLRTLQCMAVLCSLRWSHLPRGHVCHLAITSLSHRCARLSHGCHMAVHGCHLFVTWLSHRCARLPHRSILLSRCHPSPSPCTAVPGAGGAAQGPTCLRWKLVCSFLASNWTVCVCV